MIYQFSTFYPLAGSKKYFTDLKTCTTWLKKVVKASNEFWKKEGSDPLTIAQIEQGMALVRLTEEALKFVGPEKEITTKNLIKTQEGAEKE